jgi:Cu/Ag efflux pump CusA
MRRPSYAIWWNEGSGPKHVGKLEIGRLHALLSGNNSRRLAVPLDDIAAVEYRRGEVQIERKRAKSVRIGSLDAPGTLLELAHLLDS